MGKIKRDSTLQTTLIIVILYPDVINNIYLQIVTLCLWLKDDSSVRHWTQYETK